MGIDVHDLETLVSGIQKQKDHLQYEMTPFSPARMIYRTAPPTCFFFRVIVVCMEIDDDDIVHKCTSGSDKLNIQTGRIH